MIIDQQRVEFAPAVLLLKRGGDKLTVLLMSDDPKTALDENYAGNSFHLQMPVDVADSADLASTNWRFEAPSSERSDSPDGIFLEGNRKQLQPSNVTVRFEPDASAGGDQTPKAMAVQISGTFLMFDTHDDQSPPKVVPVVAHLAAQVKSK